MNDTLENTSQTDWQVIDDKAGIWCADYRVGQIRARSVALRMKDGSLMIVSPGRKLALSSDHFLATAGEPRWLLAPNHFHQAGLAAWRERFPELKVACGNQARKRLLKKGHAPLTGLADLRPHLDDQVQIWEVPGTRTGELVVIVQTDRGPIWSICDSFLNVQSAMPGTVPKVAMKLLRMGPGLTITRQFRYFFISGWAQYRHWLTEQLETHPPAMMIPAHGAILEGDAIKNALQETLNRV